MLLLDFINALLVSLDGGRVACDLMLVMRDLTIELLLQILQLSGLL